LRRFNKDYDFFVPNDRNCSACSFCFDTRRQNGFTPQTTSTSQNAVCNEQSSSQEPSSAYSSTSQVANQGTDRQITFPIQLTNVQQTANALNSSSSTRISCVSERSAPIQNTSNGATEEQQNLTIGVTQQESATRKRSLFSPSSTQQRAPHSSSSNSAQNWETLFVSGILQEFDKIMENISQHEKEEDCVICHQKGAGACYANNCKVFKGVNMGKCGFCFNKFHTNTDVMEAIRNKDFKKPCFLNCAQLHDGNNRFNLCGSCFRERSVIGKGSANKTETNYTCAGKCSNLAKSQRLVLLATYFIPEIKKDLYEKFPKYFKVEVIKDFRIFFFECMNHSFDYNGTPHPLWKLVLVNFFRKLPQFKFKD
jgi:hypothetical protein